MANKPITNQRTKKEIREEVAQIDKEVPDTKEFVKIMEKDVKDNEEPIETEDTETETPVETTTETEVTDDTEEESPEVEETVEETPKPKVQPKKELPPVEERYREAGQEAMILNSKLTKVAETVEEIENLPEPTAEELKEYAKQMGEDFDNLDTFAQNMLKENFKSKKGLNKITNLFSEEKNLGNWIKKVGDFVDAEATTQLYPGLEEMRDDFIRYASKKTHIGSDFDLLVAGFMFKQPTKRPAQGSVLLPSGKGGAGQPKSAVPAALNEDDASVYRKSDHKKYKQLIKKKKFTITV